MCPQAPGRWTACQWHFLQVATVLVALPPCRRPHGLYRRRTQQQVGCRQLLEAGKAHALCCFSRADILLRCQLRWLPAGDYRWQRQRGVSGYTCREKRPWLWRSCAAALAPAANTACRSRSVLQACCGIQPLLQLTGSQCALAFQYEYTCRSLCHLMSLVAPHLQVAFRLRVAWTQPALSVGGALLAQRWLPRAWQAVAAPLALPCTANSYSLTPGCAAIFELRVQESWMSPPLVHIGKHIDIFRLQPAFRKPTLHIHAGSENSGGAHEPSGQAWGLQAASNRICTRHQRAPSAATPAALPGLRRRLADPSPAGNAITALQPAATQYWQPRQLAAPGITNTTCGSASSGEIWQEMCTTPLHLRPLARVASSATKRHNASCSTTVAM